MEIKDRMFNRVIDDPDLDKQVEDIAKEVSVEGIKDKDIQVNGITSKGIANTGGLANIGDVAISGNLDVQGQDKGNITANIISGSEIVERMSGYSFNLADLSAYGVTLTNIYTSAVKNGNKLTLVAYIKVNNASATTRLSIFSFSVPSAVGAKLYAQTIGGLSNVVAFSKTIAFKGVTSSDVIDARYAIIKYDNANFAIQLFFADFDDLNEDYLIRIEQTFLLSDDLVGE